MNSLRGLLLGSTYLRSPDTEGAGNAAPPAAEGDTNTGADTAGEPSGQAPPGDADTSADGDTPDANQPKTLAEAMAAALEDKDPSSDPAKTDPKTKTEAVQPGAKDPAAEAAQDKELDKNPRFQAITRERDGLKPDAEQYRNIKAYMDENGLKHDQVADALELSAQLVNDPEQGLKTIDKIREVLNDILGNTLPAELQAQVDSGEMTEAAALEVSRARAKTNRADRRVESVTKSQKDADAERANEARVTGIRTKVDAWENDVKVRDPDFAKKRGTIGMNVRAILFARGENFKSEDDAVAVMKQAYSLTNHQIASLSPKPQARRGHQPSGGGARGASIPAAEPKTLGEALSRALEN